MSETEQQRRPGEQQYGKAVDLVRQQGNRRMGLHASWAYYDDPKRLSFTFSRYKFVAKMMDGRDQVMELGCADGFWSPVVAQHVGKLTAVDFDPEFIDSANDTVSNVKWPIDFVLRDIIKEGPLPGPFDGIYAMDVLEHIEPEAEDEFIRAVIKPLREHGLLIFGMPSLESQAYASQLSKEGHVNCKNQRDFKKVMETYFHVVLPFSMNDEVVHTGYHAMSHYNICVCTGKKV